MLVSFFSFVGHVHLVRARVLADDHPLVDLDAGTDEEHAALFESSSALPVVSPRRSATSTPFLTEPGCHQPRA